MTKLLIEKFDKDQVDIACLSDAWLVTAWNVGHVLLNSGAVFGVDYNRLGLFKLTQPLIAEQFGNGVFEMWGGLASVERTNGRSR